MIVIDVESLLAGVVALDGHELPDVEVAQSVVELRRLVDATDALWIRLLGEFDRRELWQPDGARSAAAWLRRECRLVHPTTATALLVARAARALPASGAAFRAGTISFEHMRAIVPAAEPARREVALRADPIFARAALWMNARQMSNVVRTWLQLADG
ncbi:DUF222 domain-containing protein [Frankia sp. AgB32]|uniref:DUF222 domain-containing protein n=1 Tax=Frankia sp. AgB32 TaxID=631119 RepID=UPI00200C56CF|nr:DUF222 domain-containing protein [Frankia sp. AgB32]MCK9897367.1 13E12 repeat family protein [Frankia sp. AgB32]